MFKKDKSDMLNNIADKIDENNGYPWGSFFLFVLCAIYLLNPLFGIDLIPDNIPGIGNLDDAAVAIIMLKTMIKLGWIKGDFLFK